MIDQSDINKINLRNEDKLQLSEVTTGTVCAIIFDFFVDFLGKKVDKIK
jgi:hypothetical protein